MKKNHVCEKCVICFIVFKSNNEHVLNVQCAHRNKCTKPKLYVKLSEYRINPAVKLKYMYGKQVLIRKRHIKYFNRTMHIIIT